MSDWTQSESAFIENINQHLVYFEENQKENDIEFAFLGNKLDMLEEKMQDLQCDIEEINGEEPNTYGHLLGSGEITSEIDFLKDQLNDLSDELYELKSDLQD